MVEPERKPIEPRPSRPLRWLQARAADLEHVGSEEHFPWRVALLLPALMIVVESCAPATYLRFEDVALQIAAPLIPQGSAEGSRTAPSPPKERPTVLLIDDEAFEGRFRERSPLDRRELAGLFEELRGGKPKLLVVDLDLSPGPALANEEVEAQGVLDEALVSFARERPLLLAVPLPVRSHDLALQRLRWMDKLCRAGVHFAHTTLFHSGAYVLRYDPTLPSLGPLAARLADVRLGEPAPLEEPAPCVLVAADVRDIERAEATGAAASGSRTIGAAYFLQAPASVAYFVDDDSARRLAPINFGYERFVRRCFLSPSASNDDCPQFNAQEIDNQVVFLGGAWGDGDLHLTPLGHREGVMLHAAAFHTEQVPVSKRYRSVAVAAEVALGLIVAFLMSKLWRRYFGALYAHPQTLARISSRYFCAVLGGGLALATVAVIAQSSAWLMQHGIWLDPLPLLAVLLLKTLFSARKMELKALHNAPLHEAPATVEPKWYDLGARAVDAVFRIADNRLQSLALVVGALPPVRRHWRTIRRLWKKLLWVASLFMLGWALFILSSD